LLITALEMEARVTGVEKHIDLAGVLDFDNSNIVNRRYLRVLEKSDALVINGICKTGFPKFHFHSRFLFQYS